MASGIGNKDDDYDSALKRLMRECLPPILVDIVDRRPPDPIEYMAHSLYKYREREDSTSMSETGKTLQKSKEKTGQNNNISETNMREQDKIRHNLLSKGLIVEESDDWMDLNEDLNTFNNRMVHKNCLPILKKIGICLMTMIFHDTVTVISL